MTVSGFVPGASITVYANGATAIGGGVSDAPWGHSFAVSPALVAGQNITAVQTFEGQTSAPSAAVPVENYFQKNPAGLTKPAVKVPIHDCGGAISVRNLVPGGLLEVFADGQVVGSADGCGAGQWVFVNPLFSLGQHVLATEKLCGITGPKSDEHEVIAAPSSLPPPTIDEVYEGGRYATIGNITNGALVKVVDGSTSIGGHASPGGRQSMRLDPKPVAGAVLTVVQSLCSVDSPPSVPVKVQSCQDLPAPRVAPACEGATSVTVTDTVPDARIRIYVDGALAGDGGGSSVNVLSALLTGQMVTATQSLDKCTSPLSMAVKVTPAAVPPYEPAYWNDPAIVGCNNCYNYGTNIRTDTFAQPGFAHGVSHSLTCDTVGAAAKADGLVDADKEKLCRGCAHRVALVIAPNMDYHWYRLDDTGRWSHKPGGTPATDRDASGNLITNPETADRKYGGPDFVLDYSIFCTYYCVDTKDVIVDGPLPCN